MKGITNAVKSCMTQRLGENKLLLLLLLILLLIFENLFDVPERVVSPISLWFRLSDMTFKAEGAESNGKLYFINNSSPLITVWEY